MDVKYEKSYCLVPYGKLDEFVEKMKDVDHFKWEAESSMEIRFMPSLARDINQYGFILDISSNEAQSLIENDINSVVFKGFDGEELTSESLLYTGCTIELYKNGEVIDKKTFVLVGDTNRDGQFDATDAVIVNCIVGGMLRKETVGADVDSAVAVGEFSVSSVSGAVVSAGAVLSSVSSSVA